VLVKEKFGWLQICQSFLYFKGNVDHDPYVKLLHFPMLVTNSQNTVRVNKNSFAHQTQGANGHFVTLS
jgi:hypothetical protein